MQPYAVATDGPRIRANCAASRVHFTLRRYDLTWPRKLRLFRPWVSSTATNRTGSGWNCKRVPAVGCRAARAVHHPVGSGRFKRFAPEKSAVHEMRPPRRARCRRITLWKLPTSRSLLSTRCAVGGWPVCIDWASSAQGAIASLSHMTDFAQFRPPFDKWRGKPDERKVFRGHAAT
jgi:hypothetical protein